MVGRRGVNFFFLFFCAANIRKEKRVSHNRTMKNVVCDVSFLSEISEGSHCYLSLGLLSTGRFFSRAANVKLLQDRGHFPACFQKASSP